MDFKCPICRTIIPRDKLYAGAPCPFCGVKMDQSYIDKHMARVKQEEDAKRELEELKRKYHATIGFKLVGNDFREGKFKSMTYTISPNLGRFYPDASSGPQYYPTGEYTVSLGMSEISPHHANPIISTNTSSAKVQITDRTTAVTVYYKKGLSAYKIDHVEYKED